MDSAGIVPRRRRGPEAAPGECHGDRVGYEKRSSLPELKTWGISIGWRHYIMRQQEPQLVVDGEWWCCIAFGKTRLALKEQQDETAS